MTKQPISHSAIQSTAAFGRRFMRSVEARILLLGFAMMIIWLSAVLIMWQLNRSVGMDLLTVSFAQLLIGRMGAAAQARATTGLGPTASTLLLGYVDVATALIAYPLLIYCYRHFFERKFFQKHMKPVFDSAQRGISRVSGSKVVAVFIFVWVPFWMTGIVVGSVLGYLVGLKHWMTLLTASVSALSAAACWVYAYDRLSELLQSFHSELPAISAAVIVALLIAARVRTALKKRLAARGSKRYDEMA